MEISLTCIESVDNEYVFRVRRWNAHILIISNSIKRGALAIKRPARLGSSGRLIANHLFIIYSFVISCFREFLLFSKAVDVNPGLFGTGRAWFDVGARGAISKSEFGEVYVNL